jgi:MoxR-like ATPase
LRDYIENGASKLKLLPSIYGQIASALNAGKHLILIGPPGTGKTSLAHDICRYASEGKFTTGITFATASADWTTFDTVGGYVPTEQQTLQFRSGIFLQAICNGEWLVIDEINRAEIDKAFGELFSVLSGQQVDLPYKVGAAPVRVLAPKSRNLQDWVPNYGAGLSGYDYVIHPNWRIIGTMNVYDKSSLFNMSFAFMRRFAFIDVDLPDEETYEALTKKWAGESGLPLQENGNEAPWLSTFREILKRDNDLMRFRALGPAIIKDMIAYIGDRFKSLPPLAPQLRVMELLAEAFLLYVTPQLDGLEQSAIGAIYKLIDNWFGPLAEALGLLPRLRALYPHIRREEWDK